MGNYHNGNKNKCPICGKKHIDINCNDPLDKYFYYICPDCGNFYAPDIDYDKLIKDSQEFTNFSYDLDHLKCFLFYHKSKNRPFLVPEKEYDDLDKSGYVKIYNLTSEMVENWYPKTFAEKIDLIILWISSHSKYMGEEVSVSIEDLCLLFFMYNKLDKHKLPQWENEFKFIVKYLIDHDLIVKQSDNFLNELIENVDYEGDLKIILTENAWKRIYELQKNQVNNKNVFVAMKFGTETQALREKIKEGLQGYNVRIMDEIEHNHQIVPEMLYEISNSKFVIAELSNHNNGAYYEAGYALGLGKEVIHICNKNELSNGLHFDVAQVNTIVYDNIDEIPEKLKKRIQATIK